MSGVSASPRGSVIDDEPTGIAFRLPGVHGVSDEAMLMFTRQIAALMRAGIPLTRSIPLLAEQSDKSSLRKALNDVYYKVCAGAPLSAAMAHHRQIFPPLYTGMIRMGEVHGDITRVIESLAHYLEREVGIRKELKAAMVYPTFILGFTALFTLFIFNFILPYFVAIFDSLRVELPLVSKVLVGMVRVINDPVSSLGLLAVGAAGMYVLKCYLFSSIGSAQWDSVKIRLPVVGRLLRKVAVARVSRSLALLIGGGINLLVALDLSGVVSGNKAYHKALTQAGDHLRRGQPLHEYFKKEQFLFPGHFSNMVMAGEEAGKLEDLLEKLAEIYEMDVEYALKSFTAALEPLMVFVTGGVIGFIILAVFLPLYGVLNNI